MPKMKTLKAASKRFKVSGTGKVLYKRNGLRHILTKKTTKRKRNLRAQGVMAPQDAANMRKLLPYL